MKLYPCCLCEPVSALAGSLRLRLCPLAALLRHSEPREAAGEHEQFSATIRFCYVQKPNLNHKAAKAQLRCT